MLLKDALNTLFPKNCDICGRVSDTTIAGAYLCKKCMSKVVPEESSRRWQFCRSEPDGSDHSKELRLYVPFRYDGSVSQMVHALKFGNKDAIGDLMGRLLGHCLIKDGVDIDCIVPVPLSEQRLRERGYNQAQIIAESLGRMLDKPVLPYVLYRTRNTGRQAMCSDNMMRAVNVHGAFARDESYELSGSKILLLDDVVTTGNTLCEAAETLSGGVFDGKILCCAFAGNRAVKNVETY